MDVKQERTQWRDLELSKRHRQWGWDCPALDIDELFLEYDLGKAIALVEYKNERAVTQYPNHPTYRALVDLGDRANIPVFAVRYTHDFSLWKITPLNSSAKKYINNQVQMTEKEYVELLYKIRGRIMPPDLLSNLNTEI